MIESPRLFNFDWTAPVPDEARDQLFEQIVGMVRRWRLEVPAVLFLEMSAPMSAMGGQSVVLFSPFLAPLFPGGLRDIQRIAKLLDSPKNVRVLIDRIEDRGREELGPQTKGITDAARER